VNIAFMGNVNGEHKLHRQCEMDASGKERIAMGNHSDTARKLFEQGYNCAQSVFAAFCDETGMDIDTALRLSSSFGGGMGRLREVCGAVTAMFMVAGLQYGYSDPTGKAVKAEHYRLIQSLAYEFKDMNGSFICRELLGLEDGADSPIPQERAEAYYQTRPCANLVAHAAEMLDVLISQNGKPVHEENSIKS
jgi:C_GCAxxG_C_C family probable redox protein